MPDNKIQLIKREIQIGKSHKWPKNTGQPVIAGTCRIYKQLLEHGYNAINPDAVLNENELSTIVTRAAHLATNLPQMLQEAGFEPMKADLLSAKMVMEFFGHAAMVQAVENSGYGRDRAPDLPNFHPIGSTPEFKTNQPLVATGPDSFERKFLFGDRFALQFSSHSGQKQDEDLNTNLFRIVLDTRKKGKVYLNLRNKFEIFNKFKGKALLRYKIALDPGFQQQTLPHEKLLGIFSEIGCPDMAERIIRFAGQYLREFEICRASYRNWLSQLLTPPIDCRFNYFGRSSLSGAGAALSDLGMPLTFRSHGALMVHGGQERQAITALFSRTVYNEPAYATRLIPRSPLQIHDKQNLNKVASVPAPYLSKPLSEVADTSERPFIVLMATNYLPWQVNYHGMTQSDFEADFGIRKLAEMLGGLRWLELRIRVKSTTKDVGASKVIKHDFGILPEDFEDVFDPSRGVINASFASHKQMLQEADLVITEGVTAVMFEALEYRTPLLLLNKYKSRVPSMPATSIDYVQIQRKRSAIYSASLEDNLIPALETLRALHQGKPLENHELENYIWV